MAYGSGLNAPMGLIPRFDLISTTPNGQTQTYQISSGYATSLFAGDRVQLNFLTGTLQIAAAGTPAIGVLQQVSYTDSLGNPVKQPYWQGGTVTQGGLVATAYVYNDPMLVYDIQVSTSLNVANPSIIQADIGQNANLAIGEGGANLVPQNPTSGNTRSGLSAYYLDFSTIDPNSTYDVKIIGLSPNIGNAFGIPFNNVLVQLNNDVYKSSGVGYVSDFGSAIPVTGSTYTALVGDETLYVTPPVGGTTITIPTASPININKVYVIKDIAGTASTHNITINPVSGNIDGGAAGHNIISTNWGFITVVSTGAAWVTI